MVRRHYRRTRKGMTIVRAHSRKKKEKRELQKAYYGPKRLTLGQLKSFQKKRISYARRYNEDAVRGIPIIKR